MWCSSRGANGPTAGIDAGALADRQHCRVRGASGCERQCVCAWSRVCAERARVNGPPLSRLTPTLSAAKPVIFPDEAGVAQSGAASVLARRGVSVYVVC